MRTSEHSPDFVLKPTPVEYPTLPSPSPVSPVSNPAPASSTFSGMTPLHDTTSGTMMSPDAMLKAYAAAKTKTSSLSLNSKKSLSHIQKTNIANGGMRVLYAPTNEESPYDEDSYSPDANSQAGYSSYYGGTVGHEHSDSIVTEEGVVTYGQRAQALTPPDNNPFRRSQAVSGVFSEGSRYSAADGQGHAQ